MIIRKPSVTYPKTVVLAISYGMAILHTWLNAVEYITLVDAATKLHHGSLLKNDV